MLMVIWWTLLCWMLLLIVMWNVLCRVDNDKTTQNNVSDSLSLVCLVQRGSGIFIAPFPAHPAFCQRRAHALFCHFCFVVSLTFDTSHTLSDIHNLRHTRTLRHPKCWTSRDAGTHTWVLHPGAISNVLYPLLLFSWLIYRWPGITDHLCMGFQ